MIYVDIVSDTICPWCYIGKVIVDKLKNEYDIELEWVSYEIDPDRSAEGELAEEKFDPERHKKVMRILRARGAELGVEFCERMILTNSRLAIEAAEYARDKGKHAEFSEQIFKDYLTYGRNIGQIEVVLDIAKRVGLDELELRRALDEGVYAAKREQTAAESQEYEVELVPTFIINDEHQLSGVVGIKDFRRLFNRIKKIK